MTMMHTAAIVVHTVDRAMFWGVEGEEDLLGFAVLEDVSSFPGILASDFGQPGTTCW